MRAKRLDENNELLRAKHRRSDDGNAFLPDPMSGRGPAQTNVELAEELAEDFVTGATSNDDAASNLREEMTTEEMGGPFLEESASLEYALGTDEANPDDATREPFPTVMRTND